MKVSASFAVSLDDRLELGALAPKPKPHVSCSLNALKGELHRGFSGLL